MGGSTQANNLKKTACILCSVNCGLEVETAGRELIKIRGDKQHPASRGYLCNKASRLNFYQMGDDRLATPMRRKDDGSYEPVDWDTAITEVAAKLDAVRRNHGGDKIYFIGGGGQGNHLGALYANGLMQTLGIKYLTNALAQEKTGEFWVQGKMFGGAGPHGDFEHAEVAVFVGKNPWQAHGFPRTRKVLNGIAKDPARSMVVLDPALTKTARMADYHLRVRPGTDAWCLSAMVATVVQERLFDQAFVDQHTRGFDAIQSHFENLNIQAFSAICDVEESLIREAARRIATASSVSVFEDLGIQQNINSTLVSYLQRILWVITGNFAIKGGHNICVPLLSVTEGGKQGTASNKGGKRPTRVSPVLGSRVIAGLLPCNEVPEEILTDHPDRFRAAIIQSSNPVHSYANSPRMREAMRALEFSVVIDVAMTETARQADYVLPAASQFEKHECTFFAVEFPENYFHLRHPIVDPLPGTLTEAEIHTRLIEALGGLKPPHTQLLRLAAKLGHRVFALAFMLLTKRDPQVRKAVPSLLYRTLGATLNHGEAAAAAPFWGLCHQFARKNAEHARQAGFQGNPWQIGEAMFASLLSSKSGFVYTDSPDYADSWNRVGYEDGRIRLHLKELFTDLTTLDASVLELPKEFPFVLAAGNRRATTSNVVIRDASWDQKGNLGSLYMHSDDAADLGLSDGDEVRITTAIGSDTTRIELSDRQRKGSIALPNGLGLTYTTANSQVQRIGIAPNELTSTNDRDPFAGTPWHKHVPARVEKV